MSWYFFEMRYLHVIPSIGRRKTQRKSLDWGPAFFNEEDWLGALALTKAPGDKEGLLVNPRSKISLA